MRFWPRAGDDGARVWRGVQRTVRRGALGSRNRPFARAENHGHRDWMTTLTSAKLPGRNPLANKEFDNPHATKARSSCLTTIAMDATSDGLCGVNLSGDRQSFREVKALLLGRLAMKPDSNEAVDRLPWEAPKLEQLDLAKGTREGGSNGDDGEDPAS